MECKSLKGEIYILNQGIHILQIVSACVMKTPILQMSSSNYLNETLFNGNITHLAYDFCPVLGKSQKYHNLIYNFGVSNNIFSNSIL